jgi:hypothetical protein
MKKRSPIHGQTAKAAPAEPQTTHQEAAPLPSTPASTGRRKFLGSVGAATAATIAAGIIESPASAQLPGRPGQCNDVIFPFNVEPSDFASNRFMKAYTCRLEAAKMARSRGLVAHIDNGDDQRYPNKIGSYSKALPHNQLGEVDLAAYQTLVTARTTLNPDDFEKIELGLGRKLTSPQAGLAMDLEGPDSHHVTMPPAPRFDSAETAGEMVELYWMALLRDVNFTDYETSPLVAQAVDELSKLSDFRGPRQNGKVTAKTLFRSTAPDDLNGPWMSQFLLQDFYFGANLFSQKMKTVVAGVDHMTSYNDWLDVQNGASPNNDVFDSTPRYIRNLRDIAQWVHVDQLYQA